jgi:hypothetical protein
MMFNSSGGRMKPLVGKAFGTAVVAACAVVLTATPARADGQHDEVAVATTGVDSGDCAPSAPCRTVGYALHQVTQGGIVRVGPGRYRENIAIGEGKQVSIVGAGTFATVLDGQRAGSVITQEFGTLSLSDLTVSNGHANGTGSFDRIGGGIASLGDLSLNRVWVSHNAAADFGGGILAGRTLTMTDSVVLHNTAGRDGGGIHALGASLTLRRSTVSENRTSGLDSAGGGIYGVYASITVEDSTISANSTRSGYGSALFTADGTIRLRHVTVAGNHGASSAVSGVHLLRPEVRGSLFTGNGGADCQLGKRPDSPILVDEYNASDDGTCGTVIPAGQAGLQPLADNEIPTRSHALGELSVLRGAIPLTHALCDGTDQRGLSRRGSGAAYCDIGAHQSVPTLPRNVTAPSIPTFLAWGLTITADPGGWYAPGDVRYTYEWQRCTPAGQCTAIPNSDSPHYTSDIPDTGHHIRVTIAATNGYGTSTAAHSNLTDEVGYG